MSAYGSVYGTVYGGVYDPAPDTSYSPPSWYQDRLVEFGEMLAEFGGVEISRNGLTAQVLKGSDRSIRNMMVAGYQFDIQSTMDIRRTDWVLMGLDSRERFTCGGRTYEVLSYSDDASEPTIQFLAVLQK